MEAVREDVVEDGSPAKDQEKVEIIRENTHEQKDDETDVCDTLEKASVEDEVVEHPPPSQQVPKILRQTAGNMQMDPTSGTSKENSTPC